MHAHDINICQIPVGSSSKTIITFGLCRIACFINPHELESVERTVWDGITFKIDFDTGVTWDS